eukprot:jgi/Picre1/33623/NNA_001103.t1
MTVTQPPIIDAQGLFKDASKRHVTVDPEEFGSVAEQVEEASRTWGVFRITNHGFDENILKKTVEMVREFFDLPNGTKSFVERTANNPSGWSNSELTKQALDLKEIFDYCYIPHRDKPDDHPSNRGIDGWNRFIDSRMREVFLRYFDHVEECCYRLLQVLCMALDVDYEYAKGLFTGESCGFCRMNFYKGLKEIEKDGQRYGIHDHTDAGFFTILWTSMARGIEFYHDGSPSMLPVTSLSRTTRGKDCPSSCIQNGTLHLLGGVVFPWAEKKTGYLHVHDCRLIFAWPRALQSPVKSILHISVVIEEEEVSILQVCLPGGTPSGSSGVNRRTLVPSFFCSFCS